MIHPLAQRAKIITITAAVIALGGLLIAELRLTPGLIVQRQNIDDQRASLAVSEQAQSNLEQLLQSIEDTKTQQTEVNAHLWSFAIEEQFYKLWPDLAVKHRVTIDEPKVAEVTPTNQPLIRAVTVVISGPVDNVMTALDAVQKIEPLIVIEKINLKYVSGGLAASVDAQTLWQ